MADRASFNTEFRILRPDGAARIVQSQGEPILDHDGQVTRFVGTVLDVTERRRLEREISEISELEQRRIGQDLHDGLCQHLAGIEFMSQVLQQQLAARSKSDSAAAGEIARLIRQAITHTRDLARGLSPVVLESDGLMAALEELCANLSRMHEVACRFKCARAIFVHDNAVATHLYRIAQEAISNAIRHGRARTISVTLTRAGERVVLGIKDDGAGLPRNPGRKASGMGLRIMQYRAGIVGGTLAIQRDPEGGTSVVCSLMLPETETPGGKKL